MIMFYESSVLPCIVCDVFFFNKNNGVSFVTMFKIAVCFVDAKDGILNYANSQRLLLTLNIELVDLEKLTSF